MSSALECRGIGKRYRIGSTERYAALRDRIAAAPMQVVRAVARGFRASTNATPHIWALRGIDLDISKGEVIGIIGRNGAGKSTLLKILTRITAPTEGEARIHGRVGSLLEVGTGFHPELTGRENVFVNGAILGMRKHEVRSKFDEIVDFSGIEQFIDTPVKRYSSGMRLRLAFAVAAHLDTEIIFIDEALSVGDASFQKKCLDRMQGISRSGRTVVLVSHQLDVVVGLCDRVLWLDQGHLIAEGPADTIVRRYASSIESDPGSSEVGAKLPPPLPNHLGFRAHDLSLLVNGAPTNAAISGSPIVFRMTYEATHAIKDCEVAVWLKDAYHRRIICLYNKMTGHDFVAPAGSHTIECHIPRLSLNAGTYNVDVSISSGSLPLQHATDVMPVSVIAGDFFKSGRRTEGYGDVLLDHRWIVTNGSPNGAAGDVIVSQTG